MREVWYTNPAQRDGCSSGLCVAGRKVALPRMQQEGGEEMIVIIGDKELAVLQKIWGKILTMIEGKPTFDEAYEVYELFLYDSEFG